jgi:hypothetical protein
MFFFLIGAIVPIPIYFLAKRYPSGPWRLINTPLLFSGTGSIPPATAIKYLSETLIISDHYSYATWSIVGFIFNFLIKRRHPAWWGK